MDNKEEHLAKSGKQIKNMYKTNKQICKKDSRNLGKSKEFVSIGTVNSIVQHYTVK